jgi:hypothetical protein
MFKVNRSTLKTVGITAIAGVLAVVIPISLVLKNQTNAVEAQTWHWIANSEQTSFVMRYHNAFAKSGLQPEDDQKLWSIVTLTVFCLEDNTTSDATRCVTSAVQAAAKAANSPAKQEAYVRVIRDSAVYLNADELNPHTSFNRERLRFYGWYWAFDKPGSLPIAN